MRLNILFESDKRQREIDRAIQVGDQPIARRYNELLRNGGITLSQLKILAKMGDNVAIEVADNIGLKYDMAETNFISNWFYNVLSFDNMNQELDGGYGLLPKILGPLDSLALVLANKSLEANMSVLNNLGWNQRLSDITVVKTAIGWVNDIIYGIIEGTVALDELWASRAVVVLRTIRNVLIRCYLVRDMDIAPKSIYVFASFLEHVGHSGVYKDAIKEIVLDKFRKEWVG